MRKFLVLFIFSVFLQVTMAQDLAGKVDYNWVQQQQGKDSRMNVPKSADFFDSTEDYKGKVIRLVVMPKLDDSTNLKKYVKRNVEFLPTIEAPMSSIYLYLPEGIKVPAAVTYDELYVTFICKNGSTEKGNTILSIERPN